MTIKQRLAQVGFLLAFVTYASGCIVAEPREGYWDHEHARWYHNHVWVACGPDDIHCR
jgi:hypothetical protein